MPPDSEEDVSPHVRLRIDPEQKKKWLDFIEDSDSYTTLTDLIKTSVTNTIDNKWMLANEDREESVPNNLSDSIEEIDSRLDAIETALLKSSKSDTNAVLHTWLSLTHKSVLKRKINPTRGETKKFVRKRSLLLTNRGSFGDDSP